MGAQRVGPLGGTRYLVEPEIRKSALENLWIRTFHMHITLVWLIYVHLKLDASKT